jgi:hypothetical protein
MGPHIAWKAGRFLMRLDIALRRRGNGDEVEATIATLRNLAAKNETLDVVRVFKEHWQVLAARQARSDGEAFASPDHMNPAAGPTQGRPQRSTALTCASAAAEPLLTSPILAPAGRVVAVCGHTSGNTARPPRISLV